MSASLLEVDELCVRFGTPDGEVEAVRKLSFRLGAGETLGIVGESGSGKTQAALALLGLLADNGRATGTARFDGQELLNLPDAALSRIRGARIAMVFQDPMTALNPFLSIGEQMGLVLRRHRGLDARAALAESERMLGAVRVTEPRRRLSMYPHELSGGMRQRVMIASALSCRPALLIADEPTTALDVTVQAQILDLMRALRTEFDTAIILITHDLGVVAGICERMLVMQAGRCEEQGPVESIFYEPASPYTRQLLAAVPRLDAPMRPRPRPDADASPVLRADGLSVRFRLAPRRLFERPAELRAVESVSFQLAPGETLGVVGESGCGKSSLARAVLRLVPAVDGSITLLGRELVSLSRDEMDAARENMQLVFQDPLAALDPRMTIREIVAEPLKSFHPGIGPGEIRERVAEMLELVGLEAAYMNRYPHQFSGGQCQRIGIARALILKPRLVICDEPVSALDVTIQAQIVALLESLQARLGLSLIFIAHDLAVVRNISHRVLVMYLGRTMEIAPAAELYEQPRHPYTRALIQAVPIPDPRREKTRSHVLLSGEVPSPLSPPSGCVFRTRCPHVIERCATQVPALEVLGGARVACIRAREI